MENTNWLTAREDRAWRGYMRMRELLDLQISRDLGCDAGLSAADYQVLVTLSEADEQRLRLIDLAERMLWSKSRLSHQLDRMGARSLVRRESLPTNSRAVVVVLTPTGLSTIRAAAPDHVASVRRHFIDLLTEQQIDALGDAAETVISQLTSPDDPASES